MNTAAAHIADAACLDVRAGFATRAEGVARIRAVLDVTVLGAEEMLNYPSLPSARYRASS